MEIEFKELADLRIMFEEICMRMDRIEDALRIRKTITINEIAVIEGVGKQLIYTTARYLLPRFGVSAYPDGVTRWPVEEYYEWKRIPLDERRKRFKELVASGELGNGIAESRTTAPA